VPNPFSLLTSVLKNGLNNNYVMRKSACECARKKCVCKSVCVQKCVNVCGWVCARERVCLFLVVVKEWEDQRMKSVFGADFGRFRDFFSYRNSGTFQSEEMSKQTILKLFAQDVPTLKKKRTKKPILIFQF